MKICRYQEQDHYHSPRLGIFEGEKIIDVQAVWELTFDKNGYHNSEERAEHFAPTSLSKLLRLKENPIDFFLETLSKFKKFSKEGSQKTLRGREIFINSPVSFKTPLDDIPTYRDFYAHEKHVAVGFKKRGEPIPEAWFEIPAYYKGSTVGFIGDQENILWPSYTEILDYELELGCVISRDAYNVKEKDASKYIFGFTILNDISARDIQKKEMSIRLGPAKGKDFCSILGPVITTFDEFKNKEPNLKMQAHLNGELISEGQSGDSRYSFSQMIEHVSKDEWVLAGDLFGSGTVGTGCGLENGHFLKDGDSIELTIEKIGTLKNQVVRQGK